MEKLITISDLDLNFNSEEFVLKTQRQIVKDFSVVQLSFPDNFENEVYSKEEIIRLLQENISILIQSSESRFGQLLYTVDIPEKQFKSVATADNFVSTMADLILRREAYKVYLRMKFYSGPPGSNGDD